jgi:hypothetical protein
MQLLEMDALRALILSVFPVVSASDTAQRNPQIPVIATQDRSSTFSGAILEDAAKQEGDSV